MIESQRDLLLKAVHELQQRSNVDSEDPPNMNKVLQELNIGVENSSDISSSMLQGITTPQPTPKDIRGFGKNRDDPGFVLTDLEKSPWFDVAPITTPSTITTAKTEAISSNDITEQTPGIKGLPEPDQVSGGDPETIRLNNDMLPTQWDVIADDTYFDYDMDSAISSFIDMDGLQQQIWQDGDLEFLDTNVMQDVH